ncbi:hypothetical protein HanRHA438_Chr03g0115571 [Helianthus annuus]|nr:hypothetical protein HanRHA438_Chr03g0115571 [Helianthus annuus]
MMLNDWIGGVVFFCVRVLAWFTVRVRVVRFVSTSQSTRINFVNVQSTSGQTRLTQSTPESTRVNGRSTEVNWSAVVRIRLFQSRSMQFGSVRAVRFLVSVNARSTTVKLVNSGQQVSPDSITVQLVSVMVQDWFEWVNWFRVNTSTGQTLVNDSQLSGQRRSTQDPMHAS